MEVKLSLLKAVTEKILTRLEESGCSSVTISEDFYWAIPKEGRYDPYSQPKELTLGQLTDDLSELERIATGESEPISYGLVWLSSILRVIGEKIVA